MGAWYNNQRKPPTAQADEVLNQANPISGTGYPILAQTANVRIISIAAQCTWTVQPSPLEVHITIDGVPIITHTINNPVSGTWYEAALRAQLAENAQALAGVGTTAPTRAFLYEGRVVAIEAEITGGTVQNLSARLKYAVY